VPVPGSHPHVAGVVLSGGMALAVYDLAQLEALWSRPDRARREETSGRKRLIVCRWGEILLGLLGNQVDLVANPRDAAPGGSGQACGDLRIDFVSSALRCEGEVVPLIDPAALFASLGVPPERNTERQGGTLEEDPAGR
jgi:chemotaxis signal transduction protein